MPRISRRYRFSLAAPVTICGSAGRTAAARGARRLASHLMLLALLSAPLGACSDFMAFPQDWSLCSDIGPTTRIHLSATGSRVTVGDSVQLSAEQLDARGNSTYFCSSLPQVWTSSDTTRAVVHPSLLGAWVIGRSSGPVTLTVRAGTLAAAVDLFVAP